jgi:hypothetical protein
MPGQKTWGQVFCDQVMVIALVIMFQFFALILVFAFWTVNMDPAAKSTILQTYVVGFTAAWGFFIGSSTGSKSKDAIIAKSEPVPETPVVPPAVPPPKP